MDDNTDLPLPIEPKKSDDRPEDNPAAALIRKRVEEAYAKEPDAATETSEAAAVPPEARSRHQKFIYELTASGKSVPEVQTAWHDYYAALSDVEKHQVWQEFYTTQSLVKNAAQAAEPNELFIPKPATPKPAQAVTDALAGLRGRFAGKERQARPASPARSLAFGLSVGAAAVVIALFSFFNERFIAPFIQPSRSLSNVPLITDAAVGPNPEVIIPKINVQIPVVYGVTSIEEPVIQKALEDGVLHYADTAQPGQNGNLVIVGHSSNNIFNSGKYKFAFVLLSRLEPGDTFYLQKGGKRYTYEVYQKKVVKPDDVSVLGPTDKPSTATLITCDPPGTTVNRLVVTGEQINPSPAGNQARSTNNNVATQATVVPGNAQSLWARIWGALAR